MKTTDGAALFIVCLIFSLVFGVALFMACQGGGDEDDSRDITLADDDDDANFNPDDDDTTDDDDTIDDDDSTDDDDDSTEGPDYPKDHDNVWDCYQCHYVVHDGQYTAPDQCLMCHSQGSQESAPRAGLPTWHFPTFDCTSAQCHPNQHDQGFVNEQCIICHQKDYQP